MGMYVANQQPNPYSAGANTPYAAAVITPKLVVCAANQSVTLPSYAKDTNGVWRESHNSSRQANIRYLASSHFNANVFKMDNATSESVDIVMLVPQAGGATTLYVSRLTALHNFRVSDANNSQVFNQDANSSDLTALELGNSGDWTNNLPLVTEPEVRPPPLTPRLW